MRPRAADVGRSKGGGGREHEAGPGSASRGRHAAASLAPSSRRPAWPSREAAPARSGPDLQGRAASGRLQPTGSLKRIPDARGWATPFSRTTLVLGQLTDRPGSGCPAPDTGGPHLQGPTRWGRGTRQRRGSACQRPRVPRCSPGAGTPSEQPCPLPHAGGRACLGQAEKRQGPRPHRLLRTAPGSGGRVESPRRGYRGAGGGLRGDA